MINNAKEKHQGNLFFKKFLWQRLYLFLCACLDIEDLVIMPLEILCSNNPPCGVIVVLLTLASMVSISLRTSLLKAIFCSFEQCSGELSLPVHLRGVKTKGQAEGAVTLYQHVCVHLCAFIATLHPSLFPELVSLLLAGLSPGYTFACFLFQLKLWFMCREKLVQLTN